MARDRFFGSAVPLTNWPAPPYENPLEKKFGSEFFKAIPQGPGVYLFKDGEGEVLYIGKAKNLKARLMSYRRAKPDKEARKVLRMISIAESIEWQETRSEKEALLLENKLLRELDPEFNVVNTHPESYYFVGIQILESKHPEEQLTVRFKLTRRPQEDASFVLFGCFRNGKRMKRGYSALLRLVWAAQNSQKRFLMPARLARNSPPYDYRAEFREEWLKPLASFLEGRSYRLLGLLLEALLDNPHVPAYMYRSLQNDIETARDFFRAGPRVNRRIRLTQGLLSSTISQHEIDDFLVLDAVRRGLVEDEPAL